MRQSEPESMSLFWVMNLELPICYLVIAETRDKAKEKILALLTDSKGKKNELESIKRLRDLAAKKGCSPHVLLRTYPYSKFAECKISRPGIYSLKE